jgi:hypothetical protein
MNYHHYKLIYGTVYKIEFYVKEIEAKKNEMVGRKIQTS